nr:hypothetical protein [Pseudomonadota bacterium]
MTDFAVPTLLETALGRLLHGFALFRQRAGAPGPVPAALFRWLEEAGLPLPAGLDRRRLEAATATPRQPANALETLAAEAHRLALGLEEPPDGDGQSAARTALHSPFRAVDLGQGSAPQRAHVPAELIPDQRLLPQPLVSASACQQAYAGLWPDCAAALDRLFRQAADANAFGDGLLGLAERFLWAAPALPATDLSLHDHGRTAAAIAACLYAFHDAGGTLSDAAAVSHRQQRKFRLVAGEVQEAGRTLTADVLAETAAQGLRAALGLPACNVLQQSGGKFLLLAPHLPATAAAVERRQGELDERLRQRYLGELALPLALSPPFAAADLLPPRFDAVLAGLDRALAEARLQPLGVTATGVVAQDYSHGVCAACHCRPARPEGRCARCADAPAQTAGDQPRPAVLQAGVDNLELVFGYGLADPARNTLARRAALSRHLDLFFTAWLPALLRDHYPAVAIAQAGGGGLRLTGPWRPVLDLLPELNEQFRRYTGNNPSLTLSAAVDRQQSRPDARRRLEQARAAGGDRVCLPGGEPLPWSQLSQVLSDAGTLDGWLRNHPSGTALLHKLLYFADQRRRAEAGELACAGWRGRWGGWL